jgi:hypothetical protein
VSLLGMEPLYLGYPVTVPTEPSRLAATTVVF